MYNNYEKYKEKYKNSKKQSGGTNNNFARECERVANRVKCIDNPINFEPQHQNKHPGVESEMKPVPLFDDPNYKGSDKLKNKVAYISGGDSGIGRAVAIAFAKEGANVAISYLEDYETSDAELTKKYVEKYGGKCLLIRGDLQNEQFCIDSINSTVKTFGQLDVLVLNQAVQYVQENIENITAQQLEKTFRTNIFPHFFLTKAALKYLKPFSSIISTCSVTAFKGNKLLVDYSSTKGAILTFTRSLATQLAPKQIRVNCVSPGPVYTSLVTSSYDNDHIIHFGSDTLQLRAANTYELAPAYVYLASHIDSSNVTGQNISVNGGSVFT